MTHTVSPTSAPALTPGVAANLAWLDRITSQHKAQAAAGARHEAAGRARHPGR